MGIYSELEEAVLYETDRVLKHYQLDYTQLSGATLQLGTAIYPDQLNVYVRSFDIAVALANKLGRISKLAVTSTAGLPYSIWLYDAGYCNGTHSGMGIRIKWKGIDECNHKIKTAVSVDPEGKPSLIILDKWVNPETGEPDAFALNREMLNRFFL